MGPKRRPMSTTQEPVREERKQPTAPTGFAALMLASIRAGAARVPAIPDTIETMTLGRVFSRR